MTRPAYSSDEMDACARVRATTGLTHRQVEYLLAVAAYERAFARPPGVFEVARMVADRPTLCLVVPVTSCTWRRERRGNTYKGALLRLARLGYLAYADSEPGVPPRVRVTGLGWRKLEALRNGGPEPRDEVAVALGFT